MKIKHLLTKTLLVAAGLLMTGANAWAEETNLSPVGVFTWTNTPGIVYDGEATSWAINQGGISGGKLGKYAGPYAIVKFDASSILDKKTLLTATLDFDITAGTYNSSINIAQMSDATFTPSTVTTSTFDATATQFQSGDWSTKNATTHFSYDVTTRVDANNVLAFAIYTNTAREQTLKDVKLVLNYSDGPVAKYSYSLKAVTAGAVDIKTLVEGEEFETNDVTLYFPYMFYNESTLYTTATTPYSVTVDKDNTTKTVTYSEASKDIVSYMEGESSSANSGFNAAYSNGQTGYAAGNKTQVITTLPAGTYTATIYLAANPNRSIIIRNTAIADNNSNTIAALPITKTSPAGIYTSDEFTLTEETTIGFSGYTSGEKTNQSADIDYIYIQQTAVPVTVTSAGFATYVPSYDLNFTGKTIEAYKVKVTAKGVATMTKVDNVPAGTPVLLYKDGGDTENIPVMTGAAAVTGNDLVPGTDAAVATTDGGYTNMILNNKGGNVGFYYANGQTVAANRAYLHFDSSYKPGSGAPMMLVFDNETTGISEIETMRNVENEMFFDLQGRKVAQLTKGLYIVNGKKVIK